MTSLTGVGMPSKLRVLDLFSGIGGFSLGLEWTGGFETVAFCEIEKYPQEVLKKNFPGVPIYDDIKELTAERLVSDGIGTIDVITGGYPCTPFSVAGKQKGHEDDRHLWPFMLEIIAQVRPTWVLCENVYGHISLGLDTVLLDLEAQGYSSRTFVVPACGVDAPHKRDRLWVVAHSNSKGESDGSEHEEQRPRKLVAHSNGKHKRPRQKPKQPTGNSPRECSSDSGENVADSESQRVEGCWADRQQEPSIPIEQKIPRRDCAGISRDHWAVEPNMGRVAHGVSDRVAKLKALGNAVVPQIPMMIGQAILDYEQNEKV